MISIIVAVPKGGKREFTFDSGAKASKWVWENQIAWFSSLKKNEQRD